MIRLLGRQTSGNVQKAIFCLEELRVTYKREDYGRAGRSSTCDSSSSSAARCSVMIASSA